MLRFIIGRFSCMLLRIANSLREFQRNGITHISRGGPKVSNLWRAAPGYRILFRTDGGVYLPHLAHRLAK